MKPLLQLRLLGAPEVRVDGASVTEKLPGKAQAILYFLAITGQPQTRAILATLLWGDMPEAAARTNLRKALAELRQALEVYLEIDHHQVAFKPEVELWVDALEFEAGVKAGSTPVDADRLQAAVGLYQADFLTGFYVRNAPDFEAWLLAEQARLRELVVQALHSLTTHFVEQGELSRGIATVQRLLNLEPWREEAHRQLMLLLARAGRRSAALAQYESCRQVLAEELGVEPAGETTALYERLKGAQTPIPHNLPPPGPFVGRVRVLNNLMNQLNQADCRLLTLVGPGGIGKTRVAIEGARQQTQSEQGFEGPDFGDGVYFVNLTSLTLDDAGGEAPYLANSLATAIAEALHLSFHGPTEPVKQLLTYLHDKSLLLILDNFEHLVAEAVVLSGLLAEAPKLKLLVTSRERLNLMEEWVLEIEGLDYPDPARLPPLAEASTLSDVAHYEAIALFMQHARQVQSNFSLSATEAEHVVRICQLVEGIPLALVLAAGWLPVLPCAGIAAEIEQSLDFLETSLRNVPDRHRSLRAVFDHSWRMLSVQEQDIYARLSIFRGGFTRETAHQVAGASLPILAGLVRKSLLRLTDAGRYELHELLRQFALEQLQTKPDEYIRVRNRHASAYASFLQERDPDLKGQRQQESLGEIAADLDNIRTAWQWSVECKNIEAISRSMESLFLFYEMRGLAKEGEAAFRRAAGAFGQATMAPPDTAQTMLLGQLLAQQGSMAIRLGRYDEGLELMRQGVSWLRQVETKAGRALAWALSSLGGEIYFQGDYSQAQQFLHESLQLAIEAGDKWLQGTIWQCLGQTAEFQGDYTEAEPYFQKSLAAFETLGEWRAKSFAQNNWGRVAYAIGEYARAEQLINAALQVRQALQDKVGIAYSCLDLGKLAMMRGAYEEARQQIERGLKICQEIGERDLMARCLNGLGVASRLLGDYAQAKAEHQQSLSIYNKIGVKREIPFTLNNLGRVAFDQGDYQRAQEYFQESLRLSQELENKTELASACRHLGHLAGAMEQDAETRQYYRQALEIVTQTGAAPVALDIFLGWAGLLRRSHPTQAIELLTFVQQHPAATHETRENSRRRLLGTTAELPDEVVTKAQNQGQSLDWQSVAIRLIKISGKSLYEAS